jgi:hypothetical protein
MFHDSLSPKALVLQKDMVGLLPSFKLRDGDGVCEHGYGQSILLVRLCFPLFSCRLSSDKGREVSLPCVECASSEEQVLPKISPPPPPNRLLRIICVEALRSTLEYSDLGG